MRKLILTSSLAALMIITCQRFALAAGSTSLERAVIFAVQQEAKAGDLTNGKDVCVGFGHGGWPTFALWQRWGPMQPAAGPPFFLPLIWLPPFAVFKGWGRLQSALLAVPFLRLIDNWRVAQFLSSTPANSNSRKPLTRKRI